MNTLTIVAGLAALGSALIAGVFFAFSSFIMTALARLPSPEGIRAMQSINVVVLNRTFLGTFIGTAILSVIVAALAVPNWTAAASPWFLAGAVCYVVGTFIVTGMGNVPLNNRLAALNADDESSQLVWAQYLNRWTALNTLRTAAAAAASVAICVGLMQQ